MSTLEQTKSPTKSCLDCVNCKAWDIPGTLEDPPEQGWNCQHPNIPDDYEDENPEEFAQNCPYFEMIDFEAMAQAEIEMVEFELKMNELIDKAFED